jgi:outer membrane protein assembly factor BamB
MKTQWLLAACLIVTSAHAADWPQWRGPNRDGVSTEKGLLKQWPAGGPKLVWTYDQAGAGYSAPAIVGDRLYLSGARGDSEYLYALDLKANPPQELWAVKIGPNFTWKGNSWNAGPSAAVGVDGDLVFALGGQGELVCVDTSGKEKWRTSLTKDLGGEVNPIGGGLGSEEGAPKLGWGYAGSPLVDGHTLICVPGGPKGTVAALDTKTGNVLWRSKELTDQATYAAPMAATIHGVRQYLIMTNKGVAGVATDGALLWYYQREEPYGDIVACTPVVHDNLVFISAASTGGGCDLVQVTPDGKTFKAEKVYAGRNLANFHGGLVLVGGHVYGAAGDFGRSRWVCLDLKSGKSAWEREDRRLGKGAVICADGHLYCLGEKDGTVMLVEATPDKWTPKGQFKLPGEGSKLRKERGGFWTHPVIAHGKLYLRDQELLYCYLVISH